MWSVCACCMSMKASNFLVENQKTDSSNVRKLALDRTPFSILQPQAVSFSLMHFAPTHSLFSHQTTEKPTEHADDVTHRCAAFS